MTLAESFYISHYAAWHRAEAELSRAGIPEGALDERTKQALKERAENKKNAEHYEYCMKQWRKAHDEVCEACVKAEKERDTARQECERLTKEKEHSVDGYPRALELMEQRDAALAREKDAMSAVAALMKLVK